jgi:hypothetical protein
MRLLAVTVNKMIEEALAISEGRRIHGQSKRVKYATKTGRGHGAI